MTKHNVIKVITGYVFSCLVTAGWGQTEGPNLIIRADDMGSFRAANIACIEGYKNGIETSIEVMAVTPWFPEAAKLLRENPGVDVGLHLTITLMSDCI